MCAAELPELINIKVAGATELGKWIINNLCITLQPRMLIVDLNITHLLKATTNEQRLNKEKVPPSKILLKLKNK